MLFRNVLRLRHVVSLQQPVLPTFRLAEQTRFKSKTATDAPSALSNLKDPFAAKQNTPPPRPDENEPRESRFRTWALAANKIGSFAIIPMTLLYCVFLADWGDHEHVFMPARRWALQQKAAFYTLTPAERELIVPKEMARVHRMRDAHEQQPSTSSEPAAPSPGAFSSGSAA